MVPYEGEKGFIFISYSHKDGPRVYPIIERLAAEGYRVWFDEGIDPGSEWPETIADHLSKSAVCMGFISENYLNSHNCKRELNFALMKQIPFLSIMLEEVTMSAGVEMQLSTNQSIFLYKLSSPDVFYNRLHNTPVMEPAFDPSLIKTAQAENTPKRAPAPEKQTETDFVTAPAADHDTKKPSPEKPQKEQKRKNKKKQKRQLSKKQKTLRGILIGAGSAVVLIVLLIGGFIIYEMIGDNPPDPTKNPANWTSLLETDVYPNLFWGKKTAEGYPDGTFFSGMQYADIETQEGAYNLSVLPISMEADPKKENTILLRFVDQKKKEFLVEGSFSVNRSSDGAVSLEIDPLMEMQYKNALHPQEKFTYQVTVINYVMRLKSEKTGLSRNYPAEEKKLSGTASDSKMFMEISAIDIPALQADTAAEIRFSDGGSTQDAAVSMVAPNSSTIYVKWSEYTRLYNGEMQPFDGTKTVEFKYFNTAPYGFILVDSTKNIYLYQNPIQENTEKNNTDTTAAGNTTD